MIGLEQVPLANFSDPETLHGLGSWFAAFGLKDRAIDALGLAVEGGYWLGEAWDADVLLGALEDEPRLAALRAQADASREEFLDFRKVRGRDLVGFGESNP